MTREELKETIIDYVIDTYSLNKDRGVVANHVDEWLNCRQQGKYVDLANVVVAFPSDEVLDEAAINFCKRHYPDSEDVTKETEVFDAGAIWMRKRLIGK